MDSRQEAKLSMYAAVTNFCTTNAAIINSIPAFATAAESLLDTYNAIKVNAQAELDAIGGITIDKADQKKELAQMAADIAAAVFAYASASDNAILRERVNYVPSELARIKDELMVPACNNILNAANENLAALAAYGVTNQKVIDLNDAITSFITAAPAPRNAVAQRSSHASIIKDLFKQGDEILKTRMDKLAVQYKTVNPLFYNSYRQNRIILDATTSATQVSGKVTNDTNDLPINEVSVQVEGESYSTITEANGNYILKIPVPGDYNITFTKTGYQPRTIENIEVTLGQNTDLDVALSINPA